MAGVGGEAVIEELVLAIEAAGFPEATAAVEELQGSIVGLQDEVAGLSATMGEGGAAAGAAGGKGLFKTLTSFKVLLGALGIAAATKKFADFQSQMERLRTQTGATQAEVGRMSSGVLSMAASVGTGPTSLATALYHIESAGFRGKAALDALRISAQGAKIGGAELTQTTTGLTAVLVAGFRGVNTLQEAMGALNATVGAGDMSFEDLNQALGTGILATFKAAGLQVKDLGASLATLGDNNIRGAKAATQMRQAVLGMLGPSKVAQEALAQLGMKPLQMAEDLRKPNGLLVALTDLKKHLNTLSPVQRENAVVQIFGRRESGPILTLLEQLDRLKTKYGQVSKGSRDFASDWKAATHTLSFFLDQVKALAEVALIKFGGALNWVIERVKGLASAFQHGKVWAVLFVGAIAGTAAVAAVGSTISMLGSLKTAVIGLFATGEEAGTLSLLASGPFGWIILAGVALAVLVLKVKPVREAFVTAFHAITGAATAAFNWVKDHWKLLLVIIAGPIGLAVDIVVTHFHAIAKAAEWVFSHLKPIFKVVASVLLGPFKALWEVGHWVFVHLVSAAEWALHVVEKLIGKVLGPISSIAGVIGKIGGGALHIGGSVLGSIGNFAGIPGLAGGGTVMSGGTALVGERGPETVYLGRGASVTPNDGIGDLADAIRGAAMGSDKPITVQLVVDRRVLASQSVQAGLEARSRM